MKRHAILLAAAVLLPSPAFAQESLEADPAAGPVDPYDAGGERIRFLGAAGVDSELDESEFKKNLDARDPFARKFDSWASLKAFDKNGNNSIDWFEADGYRKAIRDAVLLSFDKNKDGRLGDDERAAANRELAAGKTPRLELPKREGDRGTPAYGGNNDWDTNGDGKFDDEERAAWNKRWREESDRRQREYVEKWDADGDGKLSTEEHAAAQKAYWDDWKAKNPDQAARWERQQAEYKRQQDEHLRKWDANGDGKLDADEHKAANEAAMAKWREDNPEQAAEYDKRMEQWKKQQEEYTKKWDANGDGKLDQDEQKVAWAAQMEDGKKRYAEYIRKWDEDGDGKLNQAEQKAASDAAMKEWREKNPEEAARYDKQQEQWKKQQEEYLRDFDADRDGKLSGEEWREIYRVQAEKRAKDGGTGGGEIRRFGQ